MAQKMYIVEAKLGMSEGYSVIGEFDGYEEAEACYLEYSRDQAAMDLRADGRIVSVGSLE